MDHWSLPKPRLALLLEHFAAIEDVREPWRVAYPLREVLLLAVCATIANCDDYEDIVDWGEANLKFLRGFSDYHFGIPCAVFSASILGLLPWMIRHGYSQIVTFFVTFGLPLFAMRNASRIAGPTSSARVTR